MRSDGVRTHFCREQTGELELSQPGGSGKLGRLIRRAAELAVAVFRHAAYTQTAMPLDLGKGEASLQGRAEIGSRKGWVGRRPPVGTSGTCPGPSAWRSAL
jgi:hypothetical protein